MGSGFSPERHGVFGGREIATSSGSSLRKKATVLLGGPELGFVAHDGIGNDEELSCDGDEGNLCGFSGGSEALVEGA